MNWSIRLILLGQWSMHSHNNRVVTRKSVYSCDSVGLYVKYMVFNSVQYDLPSIRDWSLSNYGKFLT